MSSTNTDRIDGLTTGLAIKAPCRVATTANITLSGLQTIDGVALAAGDRVLVKDQSDATTNGIYVASTTAWRRAKDFDGARDITTGTLVTIVSGTSAGQFWSVSTANPITIGTSSIAFELAALNGTAAYFSPSEQNPDLDDVDLGVYRIHDTVPYGTSATALYPHGVGVAIDGVKQVEFRRGLWASDPEFGGDVDDCGYWQMGGGGSYAGIEAHAILRAKSDVLASCTLHLESQGANGIIHLKQRGYVAVSITNPTSNDDTDAQLNNYILLQGNVEGGSVLISAQRTSGSLSANFGITMYSVGTGDFHFATNNLSTTVLRLKHTTSGTNYLQIKPGATGTGPTIESAGGDSSSNIIFAPKGTGICVGPAFEVNSNAQPADCGIYRSSANNLGLVANGARQVRVNGSASAVNYIGLFGSVTGGVNLITSEGSDTDVGLDFYTKGTDPFLFFTNYGAQRQFAIRHTASAVNSVAITGGATGVPASISAEGESAAGLNLKSLTTGPVNIYCNAVLQAAFTNTAISLDNSATSNATILVKANNGLELYSSSVIMGDAAGVDFIGTGSGVQIFTTTADISIDSGRDILITTADDFTLDVTDDLTITCSSEVSLDATGGIRLGATAANIAIGNSLATNATAGHMWIPSCNGAATGAALEAFTNAAALIYDRSNNKLMVRCGGTWRSTAALT